MLEVHHHIGHHFRHVQARLRAELYAARDEVRSLQRNLTWRTLQMNSAGFGFVLIEFLDVTNSAESPRRAGGLQSGMSGASSVPS